MKGTYPPLLLFPIAMVPVHWSHIRCTSAPVVNNTGMLLQGRGGGVRRSCVMRGGCVEKMRDNRVRCGEGQTSPLSQAALPHTEREGGGGSRVSLWMNPLGVTSSIAHNRNNLKGVTRHCVISWHTWSCGILSSGS